MAMRGLPFAVRPVSGTNGPEADFRNRMLSNLKLLSSIQLNFKTKQHNSSCVVQVDFLISEKGI